MRWLKRSSPRLDPVAIDAIIDENVALATRLDDLMRRRLTRVTAGFVDSKRWEAAQGMELSDEVIVTIAANAAIPILDLDSWLYRRVKWIVVRPRSVSSRQTRSGPVSGVVANNPLHLIGSASPNSGPVTLAWPAVLAGSRSPERGKNVVIHEFAHKIDMSDGYSDGTPPLDPTAAARWREVFESEYDQTEPDPTDEVLRSYAWASPAEFFAVSTETFFCRPDALREAKPELFDLLADFYRQRPVG